MVASTLPAGELFQSEDVGCQEYQEHHMGLIFEEGLSFSGFERNKVFLNRPGTTFLDVSSVSGADSDQDSRAVCVADFDDDGDPDLFVSCFQGSRHLLFRNNLGNSRNNSPGNRWLKFRLTATTGQHQALGAIVRVTSGDLVQAQLKSGGSSFASQHSGELIFGLGSRDRARVEVRWPGGALESFGEVTAGRHELVEGTGRAQPREARTFAFRDPPTSGVKILPGEKLPGIQLQDSSGKRKRLQFSEGGTLVLSFWASYCRSCIREMPELEKLHQKPDHRVVAVSLDLPENRARARSLLEKSGATFPCLYPAFPEFRGVTDLLDLDSMTLPTTLWLSADGVLRRVSGALPSVEE